MKIKNVFFFNTINRPRILSDVVFNMGLGYIYMNQLLQNHTDFLFFMAIFCTVLGFAPLRDLPVAFLSTLLMIFGGLTRADSAFGALVGLGCCAEGDFPPGQLLKTWTSLTLWPLSSGGWPQVALTFKFTCSIHLEAEGTIAMLEKKKQASLSYCDVHSLATLLLNWSIHQGVGNIPWTFWLIQTTYLLQICQHDVNLSSQHIPKMYSWIEICWLWKPSEISELIIIFMKPVWINLNWFWYGLLFWWK